MVKTVTHKDRLTRFVNAVRLGYGYEAAAKIAGANQKTVSNFLSTQKDNAYTGYYAIRNAIKAGVSTEEIVGAILKNHKSMRPAVSVTLAELKAEIARKQKVAQKPKPAPKPIQQDLPLAMPEKATLRDQFAMAALTGMIASEGNLVDEGCAFYTPANAAERAYFFADAMLEARKVKA